MRRNQSSWTSRQPMQALKERASSCLPSQVVESVPACALTCLESFIQTEYSSSCANTSSLEFLCVTPNPSGFALGEAALRCVVSNCSSTSSEGVVYNLCAGIMGSVPETLGTITATVASTSTTGSSLTVPVTSSTIPSTTASPSTTALSTFASATGSPLVVPTTSNPPITFDTSTTPTPMSSTSLSTNHVSPEAATTTPASVARVQSTTLSTGAVAGIAVGGIAGAAVLFSLLFFLLCCGKKRRTKQRVNQRGSIGAFPPSHSGKDIAQVSNVPAPSSLLNQRFNASGAPQENRRSFWRASIPPGDIGIAVSPRKTEQTSPRSISSDKSVSRLIANGEAPSRWSPSLTSFPPPPTGVSRSAAHMAPPFDEQPHNCPSNDNSTFSVLAPYETRLSQPPQQAAQASYSRPFNTVSIGSIQVPEEARLTRLPQRTTSTRAGPPLANSQKHDSGAGGARGSAIQGRIPLTPIYDNGNFPSTSPSTTAPIYRWETPESMNRLSRPVPQAAAQPPTRMNMSNAIARPAPPRKASMHNSMASDSTTFEEDMTPEEERDRQPKLAQTRSMSQYSTETLARIPEGDSSPIKNLAYPPIPRPSAVSRQAQQLPRPLAGLNINTEASAPAGVSRGLSKRYELNRAKQSYLLSETISSSAGAPSLLAQRRIGNQRDLRINTPSAAANAPYSQWQATAQRIAAPPPMRKPVPVKPLQVRPYRTETTPKTKLTPKTNSRGDLCLMVEN